MSAAPRRAKRERVGKRHHLVSRGYLRFFATKERLWLCDKSAMSVKKVGIGDVFVRTHFNSVGDEFGRLLEIESFWSGIESRILPLVRRVVCDDSADERDAIRELIVLHLIRSSAHAEMFDRVFHDSSESLPREIARERGVNDAFVTEYGRRPERGEIEHIARAMWATRIRKNRLRIETMQEHYWKLLRLLAPTHVQLVRAQARNPGFITGDTPVMHADELGIRMGFHASLAVMDAALIYMPLGRRVAATLVSRWEPDAWVNPVGVRLLNNWSWRAAKRFVVASPLDDPQRIWGCGRVAVNGEFRDRLLSCQEALLECGEGCL